MKSFALLIALGLAMPLTSTPSRAADSTLLGVWVARSMESDGKPAPRAATSRIRFTFEGDTLKIKGNFADDREQTCQALRTDASTLPKQLDCIMPDNQQLLAIYNLDEGVLSICFRHASFSSEGRPTDFSTRPDSHLVMILFKRQ